jgi:hypothetical protein
MKVEERECMIVLGEKILSDHELRLNLVVDDMGKFPEAATHELIIQTEQLVEWIQFLGWGKIKRLTEEAGQEHDERDPMYNTYDEREPEPLENPMDWEK